MMFVSPLQPFGCMISSVHAWILYIEHSQVNQCIQVESSGLHWTLGAATTRQQMLCFVDCEYGNHTSGTL